MHTSADLLSTLRHEPIHACHINLSKPELIELSIKRSECVFSTEGSLVVDTGIHTGRSANDKFIVDNGSIEDKEIAWGDVNKSFAPGKFDALLKKVLTHLSKRELFIQDVSVGRGSNFTVTFRIITEKAWSALFSTNLLSQIEISAEESPDFTLIHAPEFLADPEVDGTVTGTFIIIDFLQKIVLIGGTSYAGEIKKSVFTVMNRLLPELDVFPMHCSANVGKDGETALFFGLSGTGKTTLSSSPDRYLIGDDEHGWSSSGIFNFEAGCYAKAINLRQDQEPLIWGAAHRFGAVLENVSMNTASRTLDFSDCSRTENTRVAYPLNFIEGHVESGQGTHPNHIFFLSADAFGVLPPISLLSNEQAVYYFLLGYTSKLAGTEKGLGREPLATFSACFGEPFLPLSPIRYAELLKKRIDQFRPKVWLVNTGWTGGQFGVGSRIKLNYSRAMVQAALLGQMHEDSFSQEPFFELRIPANLQAVPNEILDPKSSWRNSSEYEITARKLIENMHSRMETFRGHLPEKIFSSGPQ